MVYNAYLSKREQLNPEEYLKLSELEKSNIVESRIVPPSLDDPDDFGKIEIVKRWPSYSVEN